MGQDFYLNRFRWYARWPIKTTVLAITVLAVCFPYPARLIRHVQRWQNPNVLIEPHAPSLEPYVAELNQIMDGDLSPPRALRAVQEFVYNKIEYDWDWNTWGMADYIPTVEEAIEAGHEDCDGRAVVAASLLARLGYKAEIVTDFGHVWVRTEHGETMSPGKKKAVIATSSGLVIQPGALKQLVHSLGYGVAVFPLGRELIVVVVLWLMLLRQRGGMMCALVGMAMLAGGLLLVRVGGRDYWALSAGWEIVGAAGMLMGMALLLIWGRRNARRAVDAGAATPAEPA